MSRGQKSIAHNFRCPTTASNKTHPRKCCHCLTGASSVDPNPKIVPPPQRYFFFHDHLGRNCACGANSAPRKVTQTYQFINRVVAGANRRFRFFGRQPTGKVWGVHTQQLKQPTRVLGRAVHPAHRGMRIPDPQVEMSHPPSKWIEIVGFDAAPNSTNSIPVILNV